MSQKIANFYAEISADTTKLQAGLKGAQSGLANIKSTFSSVAIAAASLTAVYYTVGKAINATVGEFVKLADSVRTLDQINGDSAENNSRLIQTLDDYKVSTESIITAQRKLATQNETLNIPTLQKLSDEYLKLNSGAERQAFLTENFGRSSAQWAEVMAQGSKAIQERAASISESLILDQQAIDKAREYQYAQDELSDSFLALKISIGEQALPPLIKWTKQLATTTEYLPKLNGKFEELSDKFIRSSEDFDDYKNKIQSLNFAPAQAALLALSGSVDITSESAFNARKEFLEMQIAFSGDEPFMEFAKTVSIAGNAVGDLGDQIDENDSKIEDFTGFVSGAAQSLYDVATAAKIAQLSVDGSFTAEDAREVLDFELALGLVTEEEYAARDAAIKLQEAIDALKGKDITITATVVENLVRLQEGRGSSDLGGNSTYVPKGKTYSMVPDRERASGGPLGDVTKVGEQGFEYIVNGMVIPHSESTWLERAGVFSDRNLATGGLALLDGVTSYRPSYYSSSPAKEASKVTTASTGLKEASKMFSAIDTSAKESSKITSAVELTSISLATTDAAMTDITQASAIMSQSMIQQTQSAKENTISTKQNAAKNTSENAMIVAQLNYLNNSFNLLPRKIADALSDSIVAKLAPFL